MFKRLKKFFENRKNKGCGFDFFLNDCNKSIAAGYNLKAVYSAEKQEIELNYTPPRKIVVDGAEKPIKIEVIKEKKTKKEKPAS